MSDDIVVHEQDVADHDQKLTKVLEDLRERAYFEQGKCIFRMPQLTFMANQNQGRSCTED